MATRETTKTDSRLAARCAAVASGAAVIHFAVAPMHWRDGCRRVFFCGTRHLPTDLGLATAWSRPGTWVLAAGIAANATAATLWVMSCLTGPPVGPSIKPEAAGSAGICVLLLQIYVIMGAAWSLVAGSSRKRSGFRQGVGADGGQHRDGRRGDGGLGGQPAGSPSPSPRRHYRGAGRASRHP